MKFRRKTSEPTPEPEPAGADDETGQDAGSSAGPATGEDTGEDPRADGPYDVSEVDYDEEDTTKVDLGSLIVTPHPDLELQLQVDEASGQVTSVLMAGERGALELRAFAAPRNGDIWDDVRKQIASEVTRRGGTATEAVGPWGPELRVVLGVKLPDGQTGQQPSRVFGIPGPRWMLRATLFGDPALEPDADGDLETTLNEVIVRRGTEPYAPGDALPLTMPANVVEDEDD